MTIEIDQSGHVEYTSHRTVIADSAGHAVSITAKAKRMIQAVYREAGIPRKYIVQVFALLVVLVIRKSIARSHQYVIDTEYPGKSEEIIGYIHYFAKKLRIPLGRDQVSLGSVKPGSASDTLAHQEFVSPKVAQKVYVEKVIRYLLPQKRTE